ncbi:MAG: A/G-specific adenine glycosylase [Cyclobacteriaceae bacterium]
MEHNFTSSLISWYSKAKRELPWRSTKNPYNVWLSEIVLQQTRIDQGLPYYQRFVESFPDITALANASEETVLKHWEGLGYYSRARNLHATAKYISDQLNGKFPEQYSELLKLKGVGPYTAAAIASICFDEAAPVVDGNVFRFISRFFGISDDISQAKTRNVFLKVLNELIDREQPGEFNQAIMEFGATVCKPSPDCEHCIFCQECYAYQHKAQKHLPVKMSRPTIQEKYFHYFVIECEGRFLMKQRKESIWRGLYEFLLYEGGNNLDSNDYPFDLNKARFIQTSDKLRHLLTHRIIWLRFYHYTVEEKYFSYLMNEFDLQPYSYEEVLTLPKPKSIINYLQQVSF